MRVSSATGDPLRSVLVYRALKSGRGHMPQFGANVIDMKGIRLLHDWIASMPSDSSASTALSASPTVEGVIQELMESESPEARIQSLLSSTSGAMALSLACSDESLDDERKALVVELGATQSQPEIRDLFEHYLPEEQRVKRLGPTIDAEALLAQEGLRRAGQSSFRTSC